MEQQETDQQDQTNTVETENTATPVEKPTASSNKKWIWLVAGILIIALGVAAWLLLVKDDAPDTQTSSEQPTISSFEECVAAGYPVMESYPEQCAVPGGRTFVNASGQEEQSWETYEDDVYKFSFEYPGNWEITDKTETEQIDGEDVPRRYLEFKSPDGVVVVVRADSGGYGGYCEPDTEDAPHDTDAVCPTSEYLSAEKITAESKQITSSGGDPSPMSIYLADRKYTSIGEEGRTTFQKVLVSSRDDDGPGLNEPLMGNLYPFESFSVDRTSYDVSSAAQSHFHLYFYSDFVAEEGLNSATAKTVEDMFRSLVIDF